LVVRTLADVYGEAVAQEISDVDWISPGLASTDRRHPLGLLGRSTPTLLLHKALVG